MPAPVGSRWFASSTAPDDNASLYSSASRSYWVMDGESVPESICSTLVAMTRDWSYWANQAAADGYVRTTRSAITMSAGTKAYHRSLQPCVVRPIVVAVRVVTSRSDSPVARIYRARGDFESTDR